MSRRSMAVRALQLFTTLLIVAASLLPVNAQPAKNAKQASAAIAQASRPGVNSLYSLLAIGAGLFAASIGGFVAAAMLERASRSAMHIARASRITLLAGLAALLIYCLSVSYLVLFR
jgi:hypothetical protein